MVDPDQIKITQTEYYGYVIPIKNDELLIYGCYIVIAIETVFSLKSIVEIAFTNYLTNYSWGLEYIYQLLNIVIFKTILSEKILSIIKYVATIYTCFVIIQNLNDNLILERLDSMILVSSCFICIFNLINFLNYFKATQQLIIILIEIFMDLYWTIFLSCTLILSLTCAIYAIEKLKNNFINKNDLLAFTTNLHSTKSWINPYELQNNSFLHICYLSLSLGLLADESIFDEFKFIISLLPEFDLQTNDDAEIRLYNGIKRIAYLESVVKLLFIIVILAYIVILLNFVIALMSDTYSKVSNNFTMYSYRLKASYMVQWHWLIFCYIYFGLGTYEGYIMPWKVVNMTSAGAGGDNWTGESDAIKQYVSKTAKKMYVNLSDLDRMCMSMSKKMDSVKYSMDVLKQDILNAVMQDLNPVVDKEKGANGNSNAANTKLVKAKKK